MSPVVEPEPEDPSDRQSEAMGRQLTCALGIFVLLGIAVTAFLALLRLVFG